MLFNEFRNSVGKKEHDAHRYHYSGYHYWYMLGHANSSNDTIERKYHIHQYNLCHDSSEINLAFCGSTRCGMFLLPFQFLVNFFYRFIQKKNTRLVSQPIKGTLKRNLNNREADNALKLQLQNSAKDKTENVMITDLVRNDLSKICRQGSVEVPELFGIYSYPQVHQMITTVAGEVDKEINFADVLKAMFPMGSMTGAPKRKVMQLIEQYEASKRGLYSGSIGYITPYNDFDFSVIIRSILYNETNRYLSFQTGGAITFGSDAEEEYEECLLKAEAMRKVLVDN